jgi:hypothetical protein
MNQSGLVVELGLDFTTMNGFRKRIRCGLREEQIRMFKLSGSGRGARGRELPSSLSKPEWFKKFQPLFHISASKRPSVLPSKY